MKTFHLSPGFELNVKISKSNLCDAEFVVILSHFPSLSYLGFTDRDAMEFLMKLPGTAAIEKNPVANGEIFLSNFTIEYDINEKRCIITLSRNGYELKRFMLSLVEYQALKTHSYEILMMFERFDSNRECEESGWGL